MSLPPYPGQPPYGQQPPYGGSGGYGSYGGHTGWNDASDDSWSGLAIASLVCSLTCCLGVPGVVLGVVALFRTGPGRAKGRWMAVLGIVLGVVGTLLLVGLVTTGRWFASQVVTLEDAEVGECVDVTEDGDHVSFLRQDCAESHDGEIVYVGRFRDVEAAGLRPEHLDPGASDEVAARQICTAVMDPADVARVGDLTWGIATEEDPASAGPDERFLCYVRSDEGLTGSLLG